MDLSRSSDKVNIGFLGETERRLTHMKCRAGVHDLHAFFVGLRLPLDSWGRGPFVSPLTSTVTWGPDRHPDKLRLARREIPR